MDIAAYGFAGVRVHRAMRSFGVRHIHLAIVSALAMGLFYTGNRLIWLGWVLEIWPFGGGGWPSWIFVVWEALVVIVGLVTATGMWKQQTVRRWTPLVWGV